MPAAIHLRTRHLRLPADTVTPVGLYLRLRDQYPGCLLLESSDYHTQQNAFSYIACHELARFELRGGELLERLPDGTEHHRTLTNPRHEALDCLRQFAGRFQAPETGHPFISGGLFGFMGFGAAQYCEDVQFRNDKPAAGPLPDARYGLYRYVLALNHFRQELHIFEHTPEGAEPDEAALQRLLSVVRSPVRPTFGFALEGEETSNQTDDDFRSILAAGRQHCLRGNVFQLVLSRRFQQRFRGDEFQVYRALRAINPSPYLFYFDYGHYRLLGSSPEPQLLVNGREASIFPIAGTFRRTGHDAEDAALAEKLAADPKENAEHVMLVDLARNDLARHAQHVEVRRFREIQYYSHVIHLVSHVAATLADGTDPLQVAADTFPAGTLSGAPKVRAMQLIDELEPTARGLYGGCIGHLGLGGDFNHAIFIRSFVSIGGTLYYQAGAGVVAKSEVESELNEVHHKLAALRQALKQAAAAQEEVQAVEIRPAAAEATSTSR
ncbi:anthranilate synthase component I family protein [Hymenobacter busanensis]|uniref:Anthranilate synthase component 1 n=1 Tax=Hymenobacter busanensis TaxID=2607656 RepID=A0A7L4ZVJ8_9BACT|nr:anthranilate synthase component I family protein [Hymenobacter busanensis]KAA9339384.1 anthranilate synthase component I family protein [Hymenobacter busanensis]QHJ06855.1 anthranilate synthase component I family protein [Hymenobacter busanensis]